MGSFFDLQISTALFSKNNGFGLLLASIGEYPAYGGLAFFGGLMIAISKTHTKKAKYTYLTIASGIFVYIVGSVLTGNEFRNVNAWGSVGGLISIVVFLLGNLFIKKVIYKGQDPFEKDVVANE